MADNETTLKIKLDASECEEFIATLQELVAEARQIRDEMRARRKPALTEHQFAACLTPVQRKQCLLSTPLELVDPALQIYSTNGRDVLAIYDSGVNVPLDRGDTYIANFLDRDVLAQVSIPSGCYAACPGFVRLGSIPYGSVTADLGAPIDAGAEIKARCGDPQELKQDGTLAIKRVDLPHAGLADEVLMWLKAETLLGGRHARMECVEITSDTLIFREVCE